MELSGTPRSRLGAVIVGLYLFSVPAFAYAESSALSFIPQAAGVLLVAFALLDILKSRRIDIPGEIGLYGLMGLWAVATFFAGGGINEWRTLSLGTLVKVVTATLACSQLIKNEDDLFTALKIFVFSIVLVCFQNLSDLQSLRLVGTALEEDRFGGTLADPNNAAIFSLTVICASILLLLRSRKGLLNYLSLSVPIGLSLVMIYYAGSKKGLVGLGLFVLFFSRLLYLRQRSPYRRALIILLSLGLVAIAGYFIYRSPFFFRMEQLYYGGSTGDVNRIFLARDAVAIWLKNLKTLLMGVGYDNFRFTSDLQSNAHVTFLELLSCLGLVGFSLFMAFFVTLFRKFVRLYRLSQDEESRTAYFSIIIFLCIYTFFMMAHVLHVSRELLPILGCLAAFAQVRLREVRQSQAVPTCAYSVGQARPEAVAE